MTHIFSFAILKATPDPRRGERVNVGIVVFKPDGLDIRIPEVGKLRALHDGDWSDYLEHVRTQLVRLFSPGDEPARFLHRASVFEDVVRFTDVASFSIDEPNSIRGEDNIDPRRTGYAAKR